MKETDETSMAIAKAVKVCRTQVVPMYPITPQTHIVERIADFINDGDLDAEMILGESEHSVLSMAIGSSAAGSRTFTATASQGLALMNEMLHVTAGMRLPVVMAVANRALSAPISIWNDHQDSISARDTGWIQLYVESAQEAHDTVVQAYKIAETQSISLPVMVCLDGYVLSHLFEPVDIIEQNQADEFLPPFTPEYKLDPAKPLTMGPIGPPNAFMEIKKEQQEVTLESASVIKKVNEEFAEKFGRKYGNGLIDCYECTDAETIIVAMGTICGTSRVVVDELRKKGQKVGLLRIKAFRPFPKEDLNKELSKAKQVIVLDRDVSFGNEGALATEIKACVKGPKIKGYYAGIGGRDVTQEKIIKAIQDFDKKSGEWLL